MPKIKSAQAPCVICWICWQETLATMLDTNRSVPTLIMSQFRPTFLLILIEFTSSSRWSAADHLQGLQGWPTARVSGWWQLAGETKSTSVKGYKDYKDGLQPESLADGNWLVKQNQPVSKIETISDTNLRSLYESWFRSALISKSVILWWQAKKGIPKFRARRSKYTQSLKHSFKKVSVSHAQLAHFSTLAKQKHMLHILNFSTLTFITNARQNHHAICKTPLSNGVHAIWTCWNSSTHVCPNPCTSRRG
jgi:hypothetical protein